MKSERKSFAQFCPMAMALDVVGERWTLLVLRELLGGPARFQALLDGLPGIARNLLTSRLRRLEEDGLVRRVRSGNAALYALTPKGMEIRPVLEQLAFWGSELERLAPPVHERSVRAIAMALQAILVRAGDRLPDEALLVDLEIDGESVEVALGPRPTVTVRPCIESDASCRASASWFADYLAGRTRDATGLEHTSGDAAAAAALGRALGIAGG